LSRARTVARRAAARCFYICLFLVERTGFVDDRPKTLLHLAPEPEATVEAPSETPDERRRLYGQSDHVRRYGPKFEQRLLAAGFDVAVYPFGAHLDERSTRRLGLMRHEVVCMCRKHDAGA
jgi:hypothetical protein